MSVITKRIITDLAGTNDYLRRWSIWLPCGWSFKLHQIVRADDDRCSHDHPWAFLRVILWGGYDEEFGPDNQVAARKPWRPWTPWRVYYCGRNFRHRILRLHKTCSWTLVICGPRIRAWGFFTRTGWMHWEQFVNQARLKRIAWCDDGSERTLAVSEPRKVDRRL